MNQKSNIRLFKSSEDFELLMQMNQIQFELITNLQDKNQQLKEQIKHLESLLFSRAVLLNNDKVCGD